MKGSIQYQTAASNDVLHYLGTRDAALWVGDDFQATPEVVGALAKLIALPWRMALCESSSTDLIQLISAQSATSSDRFSTQRGFINIIAGNPEGLLLPPRTLSVYLLNGRADAQNKEESPNPGRQASNRRRVNMIGRLLDAKPQLILLVTSTASGPLADLIELWRDEGFRSHVVIFDPSSAVGDRLSEWMLEDAHPPAVQLVGAPISAVVTDLLSRAETRFAEETLSIQLRSDRGLEILDITECELPEHPILDRYDLIRHRDLSGLLPDELPEDALEHFFDRSAFSDRLPTRWKPFAAGLPWVRDPQAVPTVLGALQQVEDEGADDNAVLFIPSESGAGGTTVSRAIAFEVAKAGYPALVAGPAFFTPDVTEVSRFLLRVRQRQLQMAQSSTATKGLQSDEERLKETPWLIVFDVHHWRGREQDIGAFVRRLSHERRPAVVLCVVEDVLLRSLRDDGRIACDTLTHALTPDESSKLGEHLNAFLRPKKRDRSPGDWKIFWENHSPKAGSFGTRHASFWVALEFFLKRQIDLREPIQNWLSQKFKDAPITDSLRRVLLEVAALSVERQPYPEALLPTAPKDQYPFSVQLEELRATLPAIALARYTTTSDRQWAIAHDLLARYLLNAIFHDRRLLDSIGLGSVTDPVLLRLKLLESIATRREFETRKYLPLALEFAINILKLDRAGNSEFFPYWREVLEVLEKMPDGVWNTSRTFNHHVAISRRRVVRDNQLFQLTVEEKRDQLKLSIEHLNFALSRISPSPDDESDLNLYNSLARACLDLADVEREAGASDTEVRRLSELAADAARRAYNEAPQNSYVLETFASDLLQQGRLYDEKAVPNACEALLHIFQALRLETAPLRQQQLSYLVEEAIDLLRRNSATQQIDKMYSVKNAVGYIARAWLLLAGDDGTGDVPDISSIPRERLSQALKVLDETPAESRTWITLNLRYQIISSLDPHNFKEQLAILDDLEVARFRLSLQQQLERALLLHQRGRHNEANESFRALRQELRERDAFVTVPARLRMLLDSSTGEPLVCDGVVVEGSSYRALAKIQLLGNAGVPFIPQDFGRATMATGTRFKCHIMFGWKGPLAKPATTKGA